MNRHKNLEDKLVTQCKPKKGCFETLLFLELFYTMKSYKLNKTKMKKELLFVFLLITSLASAQLGSFSFSVNVENLGNCDFQFYRYSTRSPTQQIFLWNGDQQLTAYNPGPVRTYRGRITNFPNYRVFAVWYPDGELHINIISGKGEIKNIPPFFVNILSLNPVELSLPTVDIPVTSNRVIKSGYSCTYPDLIDPEKGDGDNETLVAMWENGVNLIDYAFTRDMGLSITSDLLIIPTNESVATKDDIIKPIQYPSDINPIPMFWKTTGNGGGAPTRTYCNNSFQGGRTSFERNAMPSLHHELGHTLGLKHHQNQRDNMGGNKLYYGRSSVFSSKEHLELENNICLENNTPSYTDFLHPFVAIDYIVANKGNTAVIDVLDNDIDYNDDVITIHSFDTLSQNGGSILQDGSNLIYTPPENFVGRDYFTYRAQSGSGEGYFTNDAEVLIDVRDYCNLALHYAFEEDSGTTIGDAAWNIPSHQANLDNADFDNNSIPGVVGNAISLPGNEAIVMQDILDPLNEDLSISIWFQLYELPESGGRSIIFDSGSRGQINQPGISITIEDDALHFLGQTESISKAGARLDYDEDLLLNEWYHAAMVIDRTTNTLRAYVNGVEVINSNTNNIDFDPDVIIKGYPGYADPNDPSKDRKATTLGIKSAQKPNKYLNNFNGAIDEFKIFTSTLSEAQILELFNNPADHSVGVEECPKKYTYNTGNWLPENPIGVINTQDEIDIKSGDYTLENDMTCDTFNVSPGASLTIDIGVNLVVENKLNMESTSSSFSSLICNGTVSGIVKYNRHVSLIGPVGTNDLISPPISGQNFGDFESSNPNLPASGTLRAFAIYNTTTGIFENYDSVINENDQLNSGLGYRTASTDGSTLTFTGVPLGIDVLNIPISDAGAGNAWNLIGNPYPSYLDFSDFYYANKDEFDSDSAFQAIYGYDGDASNGWTVWNEATILDNSVKERITPGQAFFVKSKVNGGLINFTKNMRRVGNTDDFILGRSSNDFNIALSKLYLISETNTAYTQLYFMDGATRGLDNGLDAGSYQGDSGEFSIFTNLIEDNTGLDIVIQSLPYNDFNDAIVPLGVKGDPQGTLRIGIDNTSNIPTSINIYLEDTVLNTLTLLNNTDYFFTPAVNVGGTGRFFLRYSSQTLSELENQFENIFIYLNNNKQIVIKGQLKQHTKVELFDISGRLVLNQTLNEANRTNIINSTNISRGVYVIHISDLESRITQKLIIK